MKKLLTLLILCLSLSTVSYAATPLKVIATFSILADFVKNVGGDHVQVISIVGPDSDSHVYEPTPSDVKNIAEADMVFINGLGFEGWIERLITSSGYKGDVITTTDSVTPRLVKNPAEPDILDPHAWHSIPNVKIYVQNILKGLQKVDPQNASYYSNNAKIYMDQLESLDLWVQNELKQVPPCHRKIITAHDAFAYLGKNYGITFLSPVGVSTEAEPRVQSVVKLIHQIKQHRIKTIFVENISNPRLSEQLSAETGAKIGGTLYSDALSSPDNPEASDYLSMMRHNVTLLKTAMMELI
jgi:zinc/manganese transport system substrate-binding protein